MPRSALRCIQRPACSTLLFLLTILSLGLWEREARGEDKQPLSLGGYRLSGSASVGYRLVEIDSGRKELYNEVVNLDAGVRLFNFTLRGDRLGSESTMVDHFSLDATDIGDPYPKIQLHVAKDEVYKFDMTLRSSDYVVKRLENTFTDNHRFDVERRFGDFTLTLFPTKDLQVHLFYRRQERDGTDTVPRMIENNVFVLRGRPDDTTNEVGAAADLSTRLFSVHLEQSYRHFNDHGLVSLPAPGLHGLRTDAPFTTMQLDTFQEGRDQTIDSWVTRLRLRATPMPQW